MRFRRHTKIMRLRPGDIIVVELRGPNPSHAEMADFRDELKRRFPNNEVVILCNAEMKTAKARTARAALA